MHELTDQREWTNDEGDAHCLSEKLGPFGVKRWTYDGHEPRTCVDLHRVTQVEAMGFPPAPDRVEFVAIEAARSDGEAALYLTPDQAYGLAVDLLDAACTASNGLPPEEKAA